MDYFIIIIFFWTFWLGFEEGLCIVNLLCFFLFSHVITIDSFWIWNFIVYYFFRLKLESWKYETLTQHYYMHHYLLLCFGGIC